MASIYKYYPRALRHYTDFKNEVNNSKTSFGSFGVTSITDLGVSCEIKLESKKGEIAIAQYYRFGLLKLYSNDVIEDDQLQTLFNKLWDFVFKNSVISVTTFQIGVTESKSYNFNNCNIETDVLGFSNSVISVLDEIGNHNRTLFKSLEDLYKSSPYGKFLKFVREDKFSTLSLYRSRLKHIKTGISEFKEIYKPSLNPNLEGVLLNTLSETEYLENLVELTENFYEKRYNSSQFIKQNRETRIALYSSVIACIVGIFALIAAIFANPSNIQSNKQTEIQNATKPIIESDTLIPKLNKLDKIPDNSNSNKK